LYIGKGIPYLPAAASLAAAHKGKVKNIRASALRDTKDSRNPGVVILTFEENALAYCKGQTEELGNPGM
jgi:1,4-dihydroxy-2-naphthoyl-CoA synthase